MELINQVEGGYVWKEIFGAPEDNESNQTKLEIKMNKHPSLATHWKGDILIHVE